MTSIPENLDTQLTIYPRRIEGTDNWNVVMELGGVDGVPEQMALDVVKIFDQLLPQVFGPMMNMATGMLGLDDD